MKKLTLLSLIFFSSLAFAQTVPPQGVNFQAVLFDEFGTPVPSLNENSTLNNQSAEATFTFYNFSSGLNYYSETHSISTDEYGRFQVVLGRGTPLGSNTFQDIVWSDGNIFLDFEVALNGQSKRLVSSQELLSVPYALFAGGIQGASDLDPDPSNEIQELAIDADSIYITKGNAVPVPLDGDKSSSNELQSLSVTGNQITISNGNTVSLPVVLDPSPTNELQTLFTQGDSLTISSGNTVITDPSSTNELQNLSIQGGNLSITNGNSVVLPISFDNDSTNEIQGLELNSNGYLKLSKSLDSIYIGNTGSSANGSNLKANKSNEFCYQGNPEVFNLSCLDNYGYLKPQMVFDTIAYFSGRIGTGSTALWYLLKVDLYSNSILSNSLIGNSSVYGLLEIVQNDSVGYIMNSSTIYKINALGAYVDTITYSGISQYTDPIVFPNADLTWFNGFYIYTYDRSNQTISSTLTTASLTTGYSVGNDSILVGNKIYSTSSGIVLKTYNITNSQSYTFRYNENSSRIVYRASDKWYSCDINGGDTKLFLTEPYQKQLSIFSATIEGMFVYTTPATSTSANYNGYFTTAPSINTSGTYGNEAICIDLNGDVYPVKKPQPSSSWNYEYMRKGLFTVSITSGAYCFGYNGLSGPWSMIRFSK